ncbi:fatty acyl-CoA reductase 1-like isoform X2 [Phymastichus coffea]|uniref:fatty acyl-CoA reductase 1-like isoform X2 n=1 Tax=Phymastichus coffea TaxID=108790 RepID=UPI00273A8503|nr:fatty acyl-CoA reductase 1-like isoform X2 [Phymastichus coffea]
MSLIDQLYERIEDPSEVSVYDQSDSEITQFFANRTIFITGVTGFLGKCLLEKLLRSCRKIKHIYILIREKSNETIEERTDKYFNHVIFDRLRQEYRDFQRKVTPIKGDLINEDLGLSEKDKQRIINEVNIIYHNAANVQFLEKVRVSLKTNVLGTKRMLDLARECKHMEAFIYVSTAYSHLYTKNIEEKCYPFAADINVIYQAIEADEKSEDRLNEEALKLLIGRHPNIYTYTKAFSEELVRQYGQNADFAHIIYRPSIVTATYREPIPGWWANTLGPVLIFLAGPMGMGHIGYLLDVPIDFIPCDLTVNALFAITRDGHSQWKNGHNQTLVYNYGSSTTNPCTLKMGYELSHKIPYNERPQKAVWYNFMIFTDHYWLFLILHMLLHFIPACIADLVLILSSKTPSILLR